MASFGSGTLQGNALPVFAANSSGHRVTGVARFCDNPNGTPEATVALFCTLGPFSLRLLRIGVSLKESGRPSNPSGWLTTTNFPLSNQRAQTAAARAFQRTDQEET